MKAVKEKTPTMAMGKKARGKGNPGRGLRPGVIWRGKGSDTAGAKVAELI